MHRSVFMQLGRVVETPVLRLAIAGITMSMVCDDRDLEIEVAEAARRFVVDDADPDVDVRVGWGDASQFCGGEVLFDSGPLWQLSRQHGELVFTFRSPIFGSIPYKVARFNSDFTEGRVLLHRPYFETRRSLYPLEYPLDELLLINMLGRGRGVEVHACGLVDPSGEGYLFVGQSGAGKSTTARLWNTMPGVTVLSDDRMVLRKVGDRIWIYGTPWHGDEPLASPLGAPLAGVFFLRHGDGNELTPLAVGPAVAELFACSFLPFHDAGSLDFTLGLFEAVARATPCHEFRFTPTQDAVHVIRSQGWHARRCS